MKQIETCNDILFSILSKKTYSKKVIYAVIDITCSTIWNNCQKRSWRKIGTTFDKVQHAE